MIDTKYEVKIAIIVISSKDYFIFNFYILYRYFESQARYRLRFHFISGKNILENVFQCH